MFKDNSFFVLVDNPKWNGKTLVYDTDDLSWQLAQFKCLKQINNVKVLSYKRNEGRGFSRSYLYIVNTDTKEVWQNKSYMAKEIIRVLEEEVKK